MRSSIQRAENASPTKGANRLEIGEAVLETKRTNGQRTPFIVYDRPALEKFHDKQRLDLSLHDLNGIDGTMLEFKSLEDIAAHYKVVPAALAETIARYNQQVASGADKDFEKPLESIGAQGRSAREGAVLRHAREPASQLYAGWRTH